MRKSIIFLCLVLTGCSSYFLAKYDTNEYSIVNEIRTLAELNIQNCSNSVVMKNAISAIYYKTILFKNFSSGFKYNDDTVKAADNLTKIVDGLVSRYSNDDNISSSYCELKLNAIQDTAIAIQQTIARKPR